MIARLAARASLLAWSVLGLVATAPVRADSPPAPKPIATAPDELGDLLRKWAAEGTAAGNDGDWYDNRDGGHSDLDYRQRERRRQRSEIRLPRRVGRAPHRRPPSVSGPTERGAW